MSRISRKQRWVEALCLAAGAGCAALAVQDEHARWQRQLIAFMAAALPVLVASARHSAEAKVAK